jgi:Rrf2 family transcriptional regulator, nitric oxide-sensitive transcriptional repressor
LFIGDVMKLSLFTDYTFRLLIQAAIVNPALVTIPAAAKAYGISQHHLNKIANELVRAGLLTATRGRNGGMQLAKPAEEIIVGDVVRLCESSAPLVECFDKATNTCVITPYCELKNVLWSAEKAFYAVLDRHTLAELTARRGGLAKIFA